MKHLRDAHLFVIILAATLLALTVNSARAQTPATLYWDQNGTTAGAGATPNGPWDTTTNNTWNTVSTGTGTNSNLGKWTNGSNAVFSAGTDAVNAYTVTVSGTVTVNSITFEDGSPTIAGTALTLVGSNITTTVNSVISAPLVGSMGLTKLGTSSLTLSGTSTYTGATAVNAGTLLVTGSTASGSAVAVNSTGTLGGTGIVSGAVTVNSGGTINPGSVAGASRATAGSVGTLRVGSLTMTSGNAIFDFASTASFDQIISTGTATLGTTASQLMVQIAPGLNFAAGTVYNLITGSSIVNSFGYTDNQAVPFDGYNFNVVLTGTTFGLKAVPEPATWLAAALTVAALGFAQRRRLAPLPKHLA